MASLEEILAGRSAGAAGITMPELPKTKLEQKKERLFGDKNSGPAGSPSMAGPAAGQPDSTQMMLDALGGGADENASLVDLSQASFYRAGGNLADAGKNVLNHVLGREVFDGSEDTGWSRPADLETGTASAADQKAGVTLEQRQNEQAKRQAILEDVADGDWLGAAGNTILASGGLAADSASTLVELLGGAALTAAGGAGAAVLGKKARDTFKTIERISDSYDKVKEAKAVEKATSVLGKVATESSKASLLTADIVQQQVNQYKEENNGEAPSTERVASMTLLTLATTAWQPSIAKKFYMPSAGKAAGKPLREKFENEVKEFLKYADKTTLKAVTDRVVVGAGKVLKAGGAEAVQEYAQSWAEILGVKMQPEAAGGFMAAAYNELADEDNRNETIAAAFMGAGAGGVTRGAMVAPGTSVAIAADTGYKGAQAVATKLRNKARLNLSDIENAERTADIEIKRAEYEQLKEENERKYTVLGQAEDLNGVDDKTILDEMIEVAKGQDLNDPEVFKKVSKAVQRSYSKDIAVANIALRRKQAEDIGVKTKDAAVNAVVNNTPLTKERIDKIAEKASQISKSAIEDIKKMDTSATAGLAEAAVDMTLNAGRNEVNSLREMAKEVTPEVLESVAASIENSMPKAAEEFRKMQARKEKIQTNEGMRSNRLYNAENMDSTIKEAGQPGAEVVNPLSLGSRILDTAKGKLENKDAVRIFENALNNYVETDFYKSGSRGAMTPATVKNLQERVQRRKNEMDKVQNTSEKTDENVSSRTKKAKETVSKTYEERVKPAVDGIVKRLDRFVANRTAQEEKSGTATDEKPSKEKTAAVKKNLKTLVEKTLGGLDKAASKAQEEEIVNNTFRAVSDPQVIKSVSKAFKTTDPDEILDIVGDIFAPVKNDADAYKKQVESVLGGKKEKAESKTESKTEPTGKGEVQYSEDGIAFKEVPQEAKKSIKEKFDEVIGDVNICKN